MELCWIKCLAIDMFFMQLNVAVWYTRGMVGTQENWCAYSHLHINLLITPTLTHLHALKFVPFRCFCYSFVCLFIIASLGRSSVCILQSFKPDWNLSSNEKKSRSKAEWLSHDICRGGAPTLLVVQKQYKELTEKKSQSKEECQSIFTDQESPN